MSYQNTGNCVAVVLWRKSLFPFFHIFFYYQTNKPTKKSGLHFPPAVRKAKGKKGKTYYGTTHNFDPHFNNIFSCWKTAKLKGKIYIKRIAVIVLVIYSNLFTFLTNFSLFVFICVISFFYAVYIFFLGTFVEDFFIYI